MLSQKTHKTQNIQHVEVVATLKNYRWDQNFKSHFWQKKKSEKTFRCGVVNLIFNSKFGSRCGKWDLTRYLFVVSTDHPRNLEHIFNITCLSKQLAQLVKGANKNWDSCCRERRKVIKEHDCFINCINVWLIWRYICL